MIIMNKRTVREISPQSLTKLWNEWLPNVLVVISLFFQILLLLLGSRRKYIPRIWLRLMVWLAYTPADRIATASIGLLTNCQVVGEDNPSQKIRAFWAPFLLLHLGGQDTITAYSSDDNRLWGRHFLGLLVQSVWAVYNFLIRSWKGTPLNLLAIPMFVAGLIKYVERTWFLLSASDDQFRKSIIRHLDPDDDHEGSSDDEGSTDDEGSPDDQGSTDGVPTDGGGSTDGVPTDGGFTGETDGGSIYGGLSCGHFMPNYVFVRVDGCVSCQAKGRKCEVNEESPDDVPTDGGGSADEVPTDVGSTGETDGGSIDGGLSCAAFMAEYDFEKADGCVSCQAKSGKCEVVNIPSPPPINKSILGADKFFPKFKRLFTDVVLEWRDVEDSKAFFGNLSSTEAFRVIEIELGFQYDTLYTKPVAICDTWAVVNRFIYLFSTISTLVGFLIIDKPEGATIEVIITWGLLFGAFVQEVYSIILLCSSNCTMICSSKQEKTLVSLICQAISSCRVPFLFPANKEWSDSMVHLSLVSAYENLPSKFSEVRKFSCISQMLEWYYSKNSNVPKYLKRLIFDQIQEISEDATDVKAAKRLCAQRGERTLEKMKCFCRLSWSIGEEFDKNILLWHLATDICYYTDINKNSIPVENSNREASKLLSEYMVHLLVNRPFMLPAGIGEIRFRDSGAKVTKVFQSGKPVKDRIQASEKLLQVPPVKGKKDRSKSVLNDASRLVRSLQCLEKEKEWGCEKKWEMMRYMWVEMLCYAACHCPANQHAEELSHGGELLTHVWFLMAHFGITENLAQG